MATMIPNPLLMKILLVCTVCMSLCVQGAERPVLYAGKSPAQIYRLIHQAKWNLDADTVLACTSLRAGTTHEKVYTRLLQERSTRPQTITILNEEIEGRMAQLLVSGRRQDRESGQLFSSKGTVWFVHEEGTWRLRREDWSPASLDPLKAPHPPRP
jgi:hypothetical protein